MQLSPVPLIFVRGICWQQQTPPPRTNGPWGVISTSGPVVNAEGEPLPAVSTFKPVPIPIPGGRNGLSTGATHIQYDTLSTGKSSQPPSRFPRLPTPTAFITDRNLFEPFCQPPPTAFLTAPDTPALGPTPSNAVHRGLPQNSYRCAANSHPRIPLSRRTVCGISCTPSAFDTGWRYEI